MLRRINRINYILIPLAMLPVFLHAQFKLKSNTQNTFMKSLFNRQSLPVYSFFLSGFKKNVNRADTIIQGDKKKNLSDTFSLAHLKDKRSLDLIKLAGKKSKSNYPAFQYYYLKTTGFAGVFSENSVNLNWQTDSNENVRFFVIERSTDRKNFNKVGEIDLAEKSSSNNFYFTDSSISNSLLYYYQVKALLIDGSSLMSDFIPVKNSMVELKASLYSGAKQDIFVLKTNQPVRKIEIINIDGQVIFRNKKVGQEEAINISEYVSGSYALKIIGHNGFVTQLFFKKEDNK